jgi:hypothetical protein
MNYAVEIESVIKFRKYWFRNSKVDRGDSQTHRQHDGLISLLLFIYLK